MENTNSIAIDATGLAGIMQGDWDHLPAGTWRYRGLCWHAGAAGPGRIVLAKADGFRYGVDLANVKPSALAAGVILREGVDAPRHAGPVLRIRSIDRAIAGLAGHVRARSHTPIAAVTGSVGKTSTCQLLRHLLAGQGRVGFNGQFNYAGGIAGETCNLGEVDYAVIEASLQGLGAATSTLAPNVAVLTHVSPVHLDEVGDLATLAERKASLFRDLADHGTAVINRAAAHFETIEAIARRAAANVLTYGDAPTADFRLVGYDLDQQRVTACIGGEPTEYRLGIPGRHMAINSLGALAAAQALGLPWETLMPRFASAHEVDGRGRREELTVADVRILVLNDAYNASPAAMESAFAMLGATRPSGSGRRIAVLSDMLELGTASPRLHERLAEPLVASGVDKVYLAGECMAHLRNVLPETLRTPICNDPGALLRPLIDDLREGDVVLFKGSHGTHMHRLVADLELLSSIAPHWRGGRLHALLASLRHIRRLERYTPLRARRWLAWQVDKRARR